jgi:peptidoglycan/xylan/chitin deacetylase (PgdA/CDA1 family)
MLRRVAHLLLHDLGGLNLIRWKNRAGLRIFTYHRFRQSKLLEAHCAHLARHYRMVSMSEVASAMESGRPLPPYACAVTVDDGFRDFLEVAWPVLAEYGIRPTVYVVTDFLDGRLWLWGDRVKFAFQRTPLQFAELPAAGRRLRFDLSSPELRAKAAFEVKEELKRAANEERSAWLAEMPRLLDVAIPETPPAEFQPLRWDEVRQLAAQGVEFGAHTRTHPILSSVHSGNDLVEEIEGSKRILEERLDRPAAHFCYPNGRWSDIGDKAAEIVRRSGFHTAVTTEPGLNYSSADRHLLRRIGVDAEAPAPYFRQCAAAFRL